MQSRLETYVENPIGLPDIQGVHFVVDFVQIQFAFSVYPLQAEYYNSSIIVPQPDTQAIFEQLKPLSLFELNRLRSAISTIMDDPEKNSAIKRHLKVGMKITYFCSDKNALVEATIEEIRKTWASVIDACDGKKWNIKFYLINLEGIDVSINPRKSSGGLDRNSLKVGDRVGWHSKLGYDLYGVIEKLNPKKALVRLGDGEQWTVSYSLLFLVMDGVSSNGERLCIEGEVIR